MPSSDATHNTIARQAILDDSRAVFGYELFDRSTASDAHTASTDAQFLFNALTEGDGELLAGRKIFFVNCTHDSLAGGHLDLINPHNVVLEIPPLPNAQLAQVPDHLPSLQGMTQRGFRLAFDQTVLTPAYAAWLPLASFIKLDLSVLTQKDVEYLVRQADTQTPAPLIAEKVETLEQFELAAGLGIKLYQGYWFAKPVLVEGQKIRPSQATILQLIDLVRKQASTNEIEDVLKRDPTLSFNLLRFINSAGFGARSEVTSFKHAVMMLGLKRLFKWAALLMTTSKMGDTPSAVGATAVVRGRLMELLVGESLPAEECDNAFVVGVFSLLDTMLGVSMESALASVSLPDNVTQALLYRAGPLAPFLNLTIACESGDDEGFARQITELQLTSQQVNWAHLQALAWAESLG
ncbi:MAG: HDOD domain-containing protein [Rhodoferax sp.]|nr:HDOD domain-containing protein [Rhodoferax sp.]